MSKTTICEGTITKTSKGDTNFFSNGNIITNAFGNITETGVENGVTFGKPDQAPKNILTTKKMPCFALFFRSKNQGEGKQPSYKEIKDPNNTEEKSKNNVFTSSVNTTEATKIITKDDQYSGNFGFDVYNSRLYGNGPEILKAYQKNSEITTNIDGKGLNPKEYEIGKDGDSNYYISWISLMKDKQAKLSIKLFSKKEETTENITQVNFKLVNLNENNLPIKKDDLYENYIDKAYEIIGANTLNIDGSITWGNLTLQSNEETENHVGLIAFYTNSFKKEIILGQSILVPNKILTVNLKFLKVKISDELDNLKYTESHNINLSEIKNYLNTSSLNQACIKVEIPNMTLDTMKIKESYKIYPEDSKQLSDLYKKVTLDKDSTLSVVFNKRENILALSEETEKKFGNCLYQKYGDYLKKEIEKSPHFGGMFDKYKNNFEANYDKDSFVDKLIEIYKSNFIVIFLTEDVTCEVNKITNEWVEGFELGSIKSFNKKVYISKFSMLQSPPEYSVYAHELAHAFGVNHTFDNLNLKKEETLENFMDYYKVKLNSNKQIVPSAPPSSFIYYQWKEMRKNHEEKKKNYDTESYEYTVKNNKEQFQQECETLFNSL